MAGTPEREGTVSGTTWLNDFFAGLMLAVAAYSLGRLVASRVWARPTHHDIDLAHILMGTAMAGMLSSSLDLVPSGFWEVVFTVLGGYFVVRCYRFVYEHGVEGEDEDHGHHLSHYLTHLVMAAAMLYMYLAAAPSSAASGGGMAMGAATGTTADFVAIPVVFLVVLMASGVWEIDGIDRFAPAAYVGRESTLATMAGPVPTAAEAAPPPGAEPDVAHPQSRVPAAPGRWLAPRIEAGCHVAMCVTMGFMLVLML